LDPGFLGIVWGNYLGFFIIIRHFVPKHLSGIVCWFFIESDVGSLPGFFLTLGLWGSWSPPIFLAQPGIFLFLKKMAKKRVLSRSCRPLNEYYNQPKARFCNKYLKEENSVFKTEYH
jgi:hypothetical protein